MNPKKIILCPNPSRDHGMKTTQAVDAILKDLGFHTVVCSPFKDQREELFAGYQVRPLPQELRGADLLITLGGDGTILHLAKLVALNKVPVLGINMGGLGFVAELEAGELETLRKLKNWDFEVEQRMMLDVSVTREGRQVYTNLGLNDAVVREGPETASSWQRPPAPQPIPSPPADLWWSRWPRAWWSVPSASIICAFPPMSSRRTTY